MTHAEHPLPDERGACPTAHRPLRRRAAVAVSLASGLALVSSMVAVSAPAAADQIADARAQAAALSAKLSADQAQIATLTGQVTAADYHLSQITDQIAADQEQIAKDQGVVRAAQSQLKHQAIVDYTDSGTSNSVTEMFSSNSSASGIRSEYTKIATGNVTTTIAHLHTAQAQLQSTESSLKSQQAQAQATRDSLNSAKQQASSLASGDQADLNGVNANIHQLVVAQQAAEAAAAAAAAQSAFNAKLAASKAAQPAPVTTSSGGSATSTTPGSGSKGSGGNGGGSGGGGNPSPAPPTLPGAAGAVQAAEGEIGVPYLWGGTSPSTGFDCSGLVAWAYAQVGISLPHFSGAQYADTTQIPLADIAPGDLLFYGPGGSTHVAMYVGGGSMIEAPSAGSTVHITGVRTGDGFVGVGRVG